MMKRILLFLVTVVMSILTMAQTPQKMNFQALIRNNANELVTNQTISVEISVLDGSNKAVYTETQSVTTNANGVATLVIGEGTATKGSFAEINWSAGNYYLQTTADLGDDESAIVGTTPLLSVPYALYAEKAGNVEMDLSSYAKKTELPDLTDYAKKTDIPDEVDLTDYATKVEVTTATTDMATKTYVGEEIAKINIPSKVTDLSDAADYAKKADIPDEVDLTDYATKVEVTTATSDMATKTYVGEEIAKINIPSKVTDLSDAADYAKKADIPDEVDLTDYATKVEVTTATTDMATKTYVGEEIAKINIPSKVTDLSDAADYAKKADIPDEVDLTDYATKVEVTTATSDMATKTYVGEEIAKINIPSKVTDLSDVADYAKKADIPTVPTKVSEFTNDANYTKSGENISVFINDVEYVKKSYVDSLFSLLSARVQTLEDANTSIKENGAIKAAFSVAEGKQVYFSMGNLQYQASSTTWRFAENQYDIIGDNNSNISSSYSGYIDLFGWGTSGYNDKYPYMTSIESYDYGDGENDIANTNYDWGVYNAISNGGNTAGMWRTLTSSEWNYVLSERSNASSLIGSATVNGVTGIILLPDDWTTPEDVTFNSGMSDFDDNTYLTSEWSKMEANGAVFLPAAGERRGTTVDFVGNEGTYWSSSVYEDNEDYAYCRYFYSYSVEMGSSTRDGGFSVRLVQDVE